MNATEILSDRARDVRALLDAVETTDDQRRLRDLATRLAAHLRVEEELLFPLARTAEADPASRSVCAEVLARMSQPGADHAKLSRVMELAEASMDGAYDAYDDLMHHAIDDAALERIGDALAARFEDGVRGTAQGLRAAGARRAPRRRSPMRAAARRR